MWNPLNKTPKIEKNIEDVDPQVVQALEQKVRKIADEQFSGANLTAMEINQVAEGLAVHASEIGKPLDMATVDSDEFTSQIVEGLNVRRGNSAEKTYVFSRGGAMLGSPSTTAEAQNLAQQDAEGLN